jgi:hypothetical protein
MGFKGVLIDLKATVITIITVNKCHTSLFVTTNGIDAMFLFILLRAHFPASVFNTWRVKYQPDIQCDTNISSNFRSYLETVPLREV